MGVFYSSLISCFPGMLLRYLLIDFKVVSVAPTITGITFVFITIILLLLPGPGVAWWFRCCATSRTVPGSVPGGVTGFFSDIFPSDHTMVLGSTQPLVKMSTRNISGGKGGRCMRLTTSPLSCAECCENLGA